ncbi:hypothetical protein FNV43_RR24680 [Rhamnella rubrinervis]|uniref:Uncharacterized protein n=1 Tax=Rhamnella rubrinervis TaxID=2594499 RepID=A0A8K0DSV9_9ROSA|nr:hypothetical protein FNV43_RR24680 [Rhamnella rubrinervis]
MSSLIGITVAVAFSFAFTNPTYTLGILLSESQWPLRAVKMMGLWGFRVFNDKDGDVLFVRSRVQKIDQIQLDVEQLKKEFVLNQEYIKGELMSMKDTRKDEGMQICNQVDSTLRQPEPKLEQIHIQEVSIMNKPQQVLESKQINSQVQVPGDDILDTDILGNGKRLKRLAKKVKSPYIVNKSVLEKLRNTLPVDKFNPMRLVPADVATALDEYMKNENPELVALDYDKVDVNFFQDKINSAAWFRDEVTI